MRTFHYIWPQTKYPVQGALDILNPVYIQPIFNVHCLTSCLLTLFRNIYLQNNVFNLYRTKIIELLDRQISNLDI